MVAGVAKANPEVAPLSVLDPVVFALMWLLSVTLTGVTITIVAFTSLATSRVAANSPAQLERICCLDKIFIILVSFCWMITYECFYTMGFILTSKSEEVAERPQRPDESAGVLSSRA